MPNHYDIDIWCRKCKGYIKTIYPDDDCSINDDERICDECKKEKEKKIK